MEQTTAVPFITLFVFVLVMIVMCLLKEKSILRCSFKKAKKVHEAGRKRVIERKSHQNSCENFKTQTKSLGDVTINKKSLLKVSDQSTRDAAKYHPLHTIQNTPRKALPSAENIQTIENPTQKMTDVEVVLKEREQTSQSADYIRCIV